MQEININDPIIQKDIKENKVITYLSYLGILCLIPLFLKNKSRFAQFHAKQGFILFLLSIIIALLDFLPISGLFYNFIFILRAIATFYVFFVSLFGLYSVYDGNFWQMPILGKFAQKLD